MSDALLKEISTKLDTIAGILKSGAAPAAGTKAPTTAAPDDAKAKAKAEADAKTKAEAATKAKAEAAAKAKPAAAPAAPAGPKAGTKAPGGKHTVEEVREIIRKVAADKNLGKPSARDILKDDGGGVERVLDLKPEFYDAVYEACEVLLGGEGGKPEASEPEDDLM